MFSTPWKTDGLGRKRGGNVTAAKTFRMKGRVVLRRIGEDRLLVPVSGGAARENCVFPLNETGEFIWNYLTQGRTLDETAAAVVAAFAVAAEEAESDCRGFAEKLVSHGLLEEGPP